MSTQTKIDFMNTVSKYSEKYRDQNIVIKFSGKLTGREEAQNIFTQAISIKSLGANICLVNGGGKQINKALEAENIATKLLADGSRDTDDRALQVINKLLGNINSELCSIFTEVAHNKGSSIAPIGMSGAYGAGITATRVNPDTLTGQIIDIDPTLILNSINADFIPIIFPICKGTHDPILNVNADSVACEITTHIDAKKLILCSDSPVLDADKNTIKNIETNGIITLIENGIVEDGMIKKLLDAKSLLEKNQKIEGIVILDGANPTAIWDELYSEEGAGTLITRSAPTPKI